MANVGQTARKLKLAEKTIILSVRPDPEPGDFVVLQKAEARYPRVTRAE
jgi:hypothetical protein